MNRLTVALPLLLIACGSDRFTVDLFAGSGDSGVEAAGGSDSSPEDSGASSGGVPSSDGAPDAGGSGGSVGGSAGELNDAALGGAGGAAVDAGSSGSGGSPPSGGATGSAGTGGAAGAPPTECTPGERSCANDTQPRVCDETGSWAFDAACAGDKPWCSEGSCVGYCCAGGAFHATCDTSNPWACYEGIPATQVGDCANPAPCAIGNQCLVPGSFSGNVEICP